jgi:hypothetical protein
MAQQLPKLWWDVVLDGGIYHIDLDSTQFTNLTALRSAAYREAELRHRLAATHKVGVKGLVVQAWGTPELGVMSQPNLATAVSEPAPTVAAASPRSRTHTCDCGQGPITHPLTCSLWGAPKIKPRPPMFDSWGRPVAPATENLERAVPPALDPWGRPMTPAPELPQEPILDPSPTSEDDEPLTPEEEEALLGPCTCGQSPFCQPQCARFDGPSTAA